MEGEALEAGRVEKLREIKGIQTVTKTQKLMHRFFWSNVITLWPNRILQPETK